MSTPMYVPVTPDPKRITVVDLSFYQDDPSTPQTVNFEIMKERGIRGVILRSGQNNWVDRDFKRNWTEAKKAGLPRGSYWFYDSRTSPKIQAQLWMKQFDGDFGEMPHFADFEERYGGTYSGWKNWYDFLEECKLVFPKGTRFGIYTGYFYFIEKTTNVSPISLEYFKRYPLWIANYGVLKPLIPRPYFFYALWQFTDNGDGKYYGTESKELDMNYFSGTEEDWSNFIGGYNEGGNTSSTIMPVITLKYENKILKYKEV